MKKRWYVRMFRTFFQSAIASVGVTLSATEITNLSTWKSLALSIIVSAVAGGLSGLANYIDEMNEKEGE